MTNPSHVSMEEVRIAVLLRIIEKLTLTKWLRGIQHDYTAMPQPVNPGRANHNYNLAALMTLVGLQASVIESDIWMDIEQYASLFARDVIVETVRQAGGMESIVMLTGNSFAPAFRTFDEIENIWQADEDNTYVIELWERIERKCQEHNVFIGYPEYDNCIYGVDLNRWERSEAAEKDEPMAELNEEWSWIDHSKED